MLKKLQFIPFYEIQCLIPEALHSAFDISYS